MPNVKDNTNEKSALEKKVVSLFGKDDDDNDCSNSSGYNSPKQDEKSFLTEKRSLLIESEISYPIMNFVGEFDNDDYDSYDIDELPPHMDAIVQVGCNKMIDETCQTDLKTSSIGIQCDIKKNHDKTKNMNENNNIRDTVIQVGPADYIYQMEDSTMSSTTIKSTTTTTKISDIAINSTSEDLAYETFINLIDTKIIHDVFLVFLTFNNFSQQQTNLQNVIETDYLKSFLWEIVFKKNYTQMIQSIIEFLSHIEVPIHAFYQYKLLSENNQMRFIDKICDDYNLTMNYNSKDFIKKLLIFLSCREDISNFAKLFFLNDEENNVITKATTVKKTTTNNQNQCNNNINQNLPSFPDKNYQNLTYNTNYNDNLNKNAVFNNRTNIPSTNYDINQNSIAVQNSYHTPNRTYQYNKNVRYNRIFTSKTAPINYNSRPNYNPASIYSAAKSSSVLSSHLSSSSATMNRSLSQVPPTMSFPSSQMPSAMDRPLSQMPSTMNRSLSQMPLFMNPPLPQTPAIMNPQPSSLTDIILHQPPPNVITPETSPVLSQPQSPSSVLTSLLLNNTYPQNDTANMSYYNNSVSTVDNSDSSLNNQLSPSTNAFSNYNLNATIRYENSSYSSISNCQQNYNDTTRTNQQQSERITNFCSHGVIQSHQNVFNNALYSNDSYLPQLSGSEVMQELNKN